MGSFSAPGKHYKPSDGETGWGTRVRDIFDRVGETGINVKAYDVLPGNADNTAGLQAAYADSRHLIFPEGTYNYSGTLTPPSGSLWRGSGRMRWDETTGGTRLHYTGATHGITLDDRERCTFRDLRLSATLSADSIVNMPDYSNEHTFEGVVFSGEGTGATAGVYMTGQTSCNCHNRFLQCGFLNLQTGIRLSGFANANYFEELVFGVIETAVDIRATGSDTEAGDDNVFMRCEFNGGTEFAVFMADAASRNTFIKCQCDGVTAESWNIGSGCNNNVLINCHADVVSFNDVGSKTILLGCTGESFVAAARGGLKIGGAIISESAGETVVNSHLRAAANVYANSTLSDEMFIGAIGGEPGIAFDNTGAVGIRSGAGDPSGVVAASAGSLYLRTNGGAGTTLYVKQSGTGTAGWAAVSP